MYRVNPFWGDSGVVLILALIVGISALTYHGIELPWRSFGRTVTLRMWSSDQPATSPVT
jgi:hypothetical protein